MRQLKDVPGAGQSIWPARAAAGRGPDAHAAPTKRSQGFLPLRGYALLSDGRSCALVGSDSAVDWWALPAMDCDPSFGALLDPQRGGRFTMCPMAECEVSRSYAGGGAVLTTTFRTAGGTVKVTDALTVGLGGPLPWTEFARRVEAVDGEVPMQWHVAPGDRFGSVEPRPYAVDGRPLIKAGGQQFAVISDAAGDAVRIADGYRGAFTAKPGTRALLAVVATDGEPIPIAPPDAVQRRIDETIQHWAQWCTLIDYTGPWRDAVVRSVFVHKQLTLAQSGGLQAAATTSLPEAIGGQRNFDYRYSWVRDTGFALDALSSVGLRGEVHETLSFLLDAVMRTAPDVRVFYSMNGRRTPGRTRKVRGWSGYRGSAPVQVGNGAGTQRQLGNYGDLLEAVQRYVAMGNVLDGESGQLVARIADDAVMQWKKTDAGLWELGSRRPYTISKIGCWVALDRAAQLADAGQAPAAHCDRWRATADEIRAYVNSACCSPQRGNYTFYAGTEDLDCATLLAARTGFCSGDDPRLHATIDAVRGELSAGGPLLYRYSGMRGKEGAFIACSFWLVEALAIGGRLDEAREVMDAMVALASDVGLLSEEIDPDSGELLGNMPQTLSHLALISAATTYYKAAQRG